MSTDTGLWLAGVAFELSLLGVLVYRRIWKQFPLFCAYCVWDLCSNALGFLAYARLSRNAYATYYLAQTVFDSVLVFCVLIEIVSSVFQPLGARLARRLTLSSGLLLFGAGSVAWWAAVLPATVYGLHQIHWILRLQQATSAARILFFLMLAGSSRVLSIGFRNRELQLATGFGVYSLATLATEVAKSHKEWNVSNILTNRLIIGIFDAILLYWLVSFARKEMERKPISPEALTFLNAIAGIARDTRKTVDSLNKKSEADPRKSQPKQ